MLQEAGTERQRHSVREKTQGRAGGSKGSSKAALFLVVMAARKCTLGLCVSKVKKDACTQLVS